MDHAGRYCVLYSQCLHIIVETFIFCRYLFVDFLYFCSVTHLNSGVLQIYPVHASDSGVYRCRGRNTAGTRLGTETQVLVTPGNLPQNIDFSIWTEFYAVLMLNWCCSFSPVGFYWVTKYSLKRLWQLRAILPIVASHLHTYNQSLGLVFMQSKC